VAILFVAYTLSFADRYILSLLIQPIKEDLLLSDTQVSLLQGFSFAIFYTLMGIPIARLADRHSRRVIIAAGIVIWSLMTAACGMARGFGQIFLARIGVGVGEAALSPAAYSIIADLFAPQKLGRALGVYSTGVLVGAGLAFIIGGAVIQAVTSAPEITLPIVGTVRSWQATFFIIGLPGVLVAALMFTINEPLRRAGIRAAPDRSGTEEAGLSEVFRFALAGWRAYGAHFLGFALLSFAFNVMLAWTPAFLFRSFDMPPGQSGPLLGIIILSCGSAGIIAGGWLADRILTRGHRDAALRVGMIAGVGSAPFAIAAPLMPSATIVLILYCPLWFFANLGYGGAAAALQQITPNRMRAVISALYLFSINLIGIGFAPTAAALLTDYVFGYEEAVKYSISITAGIASILAVITLWLGLKPFRTRAELGAANSRPEENQDGLRD
jgi:MFS family permease